MKKVYIMRGISGSGKSTYIKNNFPEAIVCSTDHYFINDDGEYIYKQNDIGLAHRVCFKKFLEYTRLGYDDSEIVVDNTNVVIWQLSPYYFAAEIYGYDVEIIEIHITAELAAKRTLHNRTEKDLKGTLYAMNQKLPRAWKVKKIQAIGI